MRLPFVDEALKLSHSLLRSVVRRLRPDDAAPRPQAPPGPQLDTKEHTPPAAAPMPPSPPAPTPTPTRDAEPDELVLSSADQGAEDGVGANFRVDPPWKSYDDMKVADITDRLAVADAATLAAVQLYESTHRNRKGVVAEVDRRLASVARS